MTSALTLRPLQESLGFSPELQKSAPVGTTASEIFSDAFEPSKVAEVAPSSSPLSNLATQLCEFGKQLAAQPRTIGTNFELAPGVALGLRLEGSVHTKTSPVVSENPFRLAATTVLEKKNPQDSVVWTQTGGVTELGIGLNGTLPLGQFASLQFGFTPSTLLRYRCIQPHVVGFFHTAGSALKQGGGLFPFSAQAATRLSAGSEYELAGLGRVTFSGALSTNFGGPSGTPISVGVGGTLFNDESVAKEVALNVLSLDGANRVRVTLKKADEETTRFGAKAYAGISSQLSSVWPEIGQGLLQKGVGWLGGTISDALLNYFATFSIQASTANQNKDTVIATFDFDLGQADACAAYDELMKLSCGKADALSAIEGSGVRQLCQTEKEHADTDEFSASLFGDKLALFQALKDEKNGSFKTPDGKTTLYRQANFKKHESGWFDPTKDVLWETVTLKNLETQTAKSFFHFRYQKSGELREQEYDDFFKLAQFLSLPQSNGPDDQESKRLICQSLEACLTTDLYFTHDGIAAIAKTNPEKVTNTFLDIAGKLRPELALAPLQARPLLWPKLEMLLTKYIAECQEGWFLNFGYFDRLSQWEQQYQELCGRSLEHDACTYRNACDFAGRVAHLKDPNDPRSLEQFFVSLGQGKGFAYQISVAALATLAGDKDTLVHQHELKGNGLAFKYDNEGKLEEPSEIIKSMLSKML